MKEKDNYIFVSTEVATRILGTKKIAKLKKEYDQAKEIWNASQENMHRQFSSSAYKPITFDQWYSNRNK
jgi:hypothetical protein